MATPTPNIVGDTTADNFGTSQTNPDPTAGWANQAAARAVRG